MKRYLSLLAIALIPGCQDSLDATNGEERVIGKITKAAPKNGPGIGTTIDPGIKDVKAAKAEDERKNQEEIHAREAERIKQEKLIYGQAGEKVKGEETTEKRNEETFGTPTNTRPNLTVAELEKKLVGTFETQPGSSVFVSFTFALHTYTLNPSPSFVWAAGSNGHWRLNNSPVWLSDQDAANGYYMFIFYAPDDPRSEVPFYSKIKFEFDENNRITKMRLTNLMGLKFSSENEGVLIRKD